MTDDPANNVQLTDTKKQQFLEKIRANAAAREDKQHATRTESDDRIRRYQEDRENGARGDSDGMAQRSRGTTEQQQGTQQVNRPPEGYDSRVRSSHRESITSNQGLDPDNRGYQTERVGLGFQLKNPFHRDKAEQRPVKLFSKKEAEEEKERMTFIYQKGHSLLDDLLEIITKDHEPVSIWMLSDEEAEMLAEIHLHKAMTSESAARSARKLLDLYDRLYTLMIYAPRLKASASYIKEHGGFSFK